ncbi:molecular chaperone DnaJ [Myxococcota bacterium]
MRDFYDVLGVDRDATKKEIKQAYHRLAHKFHPDKNPDDRAAEDRFKEATRAYDVLSNPDKRRKYDRLGPTGFQDGGQDFRSGFSGFGDVFSEIFGDFFGRKHSGVGKRGRDRTYTLDIEFHTAVLGGEHTIEVSRASRCKHCSGTGSHPGSSPQICHACGGSGEIRVQQGLLSVSKKCTYCRGKGKIITKPCKDCDGRGHIERKTDLRVRIPPGSDEDTVLRYAGEGEPGTNGGRSGDLRILLNVESHPVLTRDGPDLLCEVPVTFVEAALGAQIEVPTLDGRVRMRLPPGTQSGHIFRLRGKGVPRASDEHGDQHVTVKVEIPTALNESQRQAIETLRQLDDQHYPERKAFWRKVDGLK